MRVDWSGYRKRNGYVLGRGVVAGYEKRLIRISFAIPVAWPTVWKDRPDFLAPAPKLDVEAFDERARMKRMQP